MDIFQPARLLNNLLPHRCGNPIRFLHIQSRTVLPWESPFVKINQQGVLIILDVSQLIFPTAVLMIDSHTWSYKLHSRGSASAVVLVDFIPAAGVVQTERKILQVYLLELPTSDLLSITQPAIRSILHRRSSVTSHTLDQLLSPMKSRCVLIEALRPRYIDLSTNR